MNATTEGLGPREQRVYNAYLSALQAGRHTGAPALSRQLTESGPSICSSSVKRILQRLRDQRLVPPRASGDSRPAALIPAADAPEAALYLGGGIGDLAGALGQAREHYEESGNEACLSVVKPDNPKTLEELIAVCQIDLDTWQVQRWVANKWQQAAKMLVGKDLPQQIVETPLYQIKVWLVRRVAQSLHSEVPAFQPVHCTVSRLPPATAATGDGLRAGVVIPDPHIGFRRDTQTGVLTPFHDRKAIAAVLELVSEVQPERIVVLGDLCDLPDFSDKFLKSPEFYWTFQPTLYETGWMLAQLRALAPNAIIDLIPGNHDDRLRKAIINHLIFLYGIKPANAPDARPLLSWENLLGLDKLRITCHDDYPQGRVWWNRRLVFRHGEELSNQSGGTVTKTLKSGNGRSDGYGHTHRLESAFRTSHDFDGPVHYSATSFGTLADLVGPLPGFGSEHNWQNGCGVVWYDENDFQTELLHIQRGRLIWEGQWIEGADYLPQLRADTGWEGFG